MQTSYLLVKTVVQDECISKSICKPSETDSIKLKINRLPYIEE